MSRFASAHTKEFSKNVIEALGTRNGTLMANHGCLVCGRTIQHALKMAELVEKLVWIHYGSIQLGETFIISKESCPWFVDIFEDQFAAHDENCSE